MTPDRRPHGTAADTAEATAHWRDMERSYGRSAIHDALGLTLRVDGAGAVTVRYDGSPSAGNRSARVSGGAIAAMIDSAATQAIRTLLGPEDAVVTVDLIVSFIRSADTGQPLTTSGEVVRVGGALAFGRARTVDTNGDVVASGSATVSLRRAAKQR